MILNDNILCKKKSSIKYKNNSHINYKFIICELSMIFKIKSKRNYKIY